jgi:hypothetical protein
MLVDQWPDGTPRQNGDPYYDKRPGYQQRVEAALEAHRRHCAAPECPCRQP